MDWIAPSMSVDWGWGDHWSAFRPGVSACFAVLRDLCSSLRHDDDESLHSVLAVCTCSRAGSGTWVRDSLRAGYCSTAYLLLQQEGAGAGHGHQWGKFG